MKNHLQNLLKRFTGFWWGDKGLSALLVLLLLTFTLAPLIKSQVASLISSIFFSLLLLSGIHNISTKRLHRIGVGMFALVGITFNWLKHFNPASMPWQTWSDLISLCYLVLLTLVVMRHVYEKGPVSIDRILGAIAAYILVGFTWAILYHLIELRLPGSFRLTEAASGDIYISKQSNFTYFSFITMTTVGYGDITPIHPTARMFAIIEALIGQLYPATLLARLVSLQIIHRNEESARAAAERESAEDGLD